MNYIVDQVPSNGKRYNDHIQLLLNCTDKIPRSLDKNWKVKSIFRTSFPSYIDMSGEFRVGQYFSLNFPIQNDVKQGNALPPLFLNVV